MSLRPFTRISLIASAALLAIGIGSVALSVERPLTQEQWATWQSGGEAHVSYFTGMNDEASRSWDYAGYMAAREEANHARGQCGFASMDGELCALGGYAAPINWLALGFLALGLFGFARARMSDSYDGIHA